jgi:LPPG:FO 2-phospho-L-lactate transferase
VLEFQDYFVRRQWQPIIRRIFFAGAETARATPQVISALAQADAIIIAPSNPFVSVDPILSLIPLPPSPESSFDFAALRAGCDSGGEGGTTAPPLPKSSSRFRERGPGGEVPLLAVSPIVGGQALKGPAAKMFRELGWEPSALAVAQYYQGLVSHFVLDQLDADQESAIQSLGMKTLVTNTIMQSVDDRARLASEVVEFVKRKA